MKCLVTGSAGFIGAATAKKLLDQGFEVVGVDNHNAYYDPTLKDYRLSTLLPYKNYTHHKLDLADQENIRKLFALENFSRVIHLGAQAGVRYSLEAPFEYIESNITGTMTVLEGCRHHDIEHLVFASSSSVYGMNPKIPFSESDSVDHPVSLYAATKKSNELLAHSYSHLYGIPTTGLRLFTVYGPSGRPDMAPWLFTEAILNEQPIKVFNNGQMERDFTYIDDIVEGIIRISDVIPSPNPNDTLTNPSTSKAPFRLYNIGNNLPVQLTEFIEAIENACGKKAKKTLLPMQPGDVPRTFADIDSLNAVTNYLPSTDIHRGIEKFVEWYLNRPS